MAKLQGFNERVEVASTVFYVDWWYNEEDDEVVLEMVVDDWGERVPFRSSKRSSIRNEIRYRHIDWYD